MQENYYEVLGLISTSSKGGIPVYDCSVDDITKAFRKASLKWHPDRNPNNVVEATRKFAQINNANQTLSDPLKRKRYDELRAGNIATSDGNTSLGELKRYEFMRNGVQLYLDVQLPPNDECDFPFEEFFNTFYNDAIQKGFITFEMTTIGNLSYRQPKLTPNLADRLIWKFTQQYSIYLLNKAKAELKIDFDKAVGHWYQDFIAAFEIDDYLDENKKQEFYTIVQEKAQHIDYTGLDLDWNLYLKHLEKYVFGADLLKKIMPAVLRKECTPNFFIELYKRHPGNRSLMSIIAAALSEHYHFNAYGLEKCLIASANNAFDMKGLLNSPYPSLFPLIHLKIYNENELSAQLRALGDIDVGTNFIAAITNRVFSTLDTDHFTGPGLIKKLNTTKKLIGTDYFKWLKTNLMDQLKSSEFDLGSATNLDNLSSDIVNIIAAHITTSEHSINMKELHAEIEERLETFAEEPEVSNYQHFSDYMVSVIGFFLAVPFLLLPIVLSHRYCETFFWSKGQTKTDKLLMQFAEIDEPTLIEPMKL